MVECLSCHEFYHHSCEKIPKTVSTETGLFCSSCTVLYVNTKDFNVHYQIWLSPPYTDQLCELVLNIAILHHLCIHHLIIIFHGITGTDSSLYAETMAEVCTEENFLHFFFQHLKLLLKLACSIYMYICKAVICSSVYLAVRIQ